MLPLNEEQTAPRRAGALYRKHPSRRRAAVDGLLGDDWTSHAVRAAHAMQLYAQLWV